MHELHIIRDLFDDIVQRAAENDAKKVTTVNLTMGEFTEINEEILRHFFSENGKGTLIEGAKLNIEKSPTRELRLVSFDVD